MRGYSGTREKEARRGNTLEGSCVPGPARVGDAAGEQGGNAALSNPGSTECL